MEYKVVKRPHVVPRGYLRGFAKDDIVAMHLVGSSGAREVPVSKAGVLKDFYRRHRPDGTPIYDVEWSLEHIDKVVPPLLREIAERWPLTLSDKAILAEFVGTQLLRGPRWRAWHEARTRDYIAEVRASGEFEGRQAVGMTLDEALAQAERDLTSDTAALIKMLELARKVTQVIGSMHWTLIEFPRPWLATSDHPVIVWPLAARSRQPKKSDNFVEGGLVATLEARFPVSAQHALLMTWLDVPDDEATIVTGTKTDAANLNAFTVAEGENQWFHLPGITAPRASGQLLPLSPFMLRPYSAAIAVDSLRRGETDRRIQPRIGDGVLNAEFELVTIGRSGGTDMVRVDTEPEKERSSDAA